MGQHKIVYNVPGNKNGPSEEEYPDTVPPVPVRLNDLVFVGHPVFVPVEDGCGVVHTKNINVFHLKSSRLQLRDDPAK